MSIGKIIPKVRKGQKVENVLTQEEIEGKSLDELNVGIGDYIVLINGYEVGDSTMVPNLNRLTQYAGAVVIDDANPCKIQILKRGNTDKDTWVEDEVWMVCKNRLDDKLVVTDNLDTFEKAGYTDLEVGFWKDERIGHYENVKELHEDSYEGWDESEYYEYLSEQDQDCENRDKQIWQYEQQIADLQGEIDAMKRHYEHELAMKKQINENLHAGHENQGDQ